MSELQPTPHPITREYGVLQLISQHGAIGVLNPMLALVSHGGVCHGSQIALNWRRRRFGQLLPEIVALPMASDQYRQVTGGTPLSQVE